MRCRGAKRGTVDLYWCYFPRIVGYLFWSLTTTKDLHFVSLVTSSYCSLSLVVQNSWNCLLLSSFTDLAVFTIVASIMSRVSKRRKFPIWSKEGLPFSLIMLHRDWTWLWKELCTPLGSSLGWCCRSSAVGFSDSWEISNSLIILDICCPDTNQNSVDIFVRQIAPPSPLTSLISCLWVWSMDSAENARFVLSRTKWPFLNCIATLIWKFRIQVFHVLIMWMSRYLA